MAPPPVLGPDDIHPYVGLDIPSLVDIRAASTPDKPFLVWEPLAGEADSVSYAAFRDRTRSFAAGLAARGIGPGDRVLIHLDNCPQLLEVWHACARLGAVAVPTGTRSTSAEFSYFVKHSKCRAVVTQPGRLALVLQNVPPKTLLICTDHDPDGPATGNLDPRCLSYAECAGDLDADPPRTPDPLANCSVLYTSGTTAMPKGVVWTHANALWGGFVCSAHLGLTPGDVGLTYMPLHHANALCYSHLGTLCSGGTLVLMPRFSASRFWPIAIGNRCSWASMIPFATKALMSQPDPATAHSFRCWGGPFADPAAEQRWSIRTVGWWGMTETVSHCIVGHRTLPNSTGSMGVAATEYDISVLKADGTPVREGETGHLRIRGIRGLSLFREYLDDPQATALAFDEEGWLVTGDLVTRLPRGQWMFSDRNKDMLKVGGENVAPSELERLIATVTGVAEVSVVSRPDHMLDEVPVACVVPAEPAGSDLEARIRAVCAERLAPFKQPRSVLFMADFPRAALNKVDKASLRRQVRARFETQE